MVRYSDFDKNPSFPSDVPVAKLERISLAKLKANDKSASQALWKACTTAGFFLVDLEDDDSGKRILKDVDELFEMGEKLFDLPFEEKMESVMGGSRSIFGYKGIGLSKVDEEGTPDRCEFYGVSKDDILGIKPQLHAPSVVDNHRELLKHFCEEGHAIATIVMNHLDDHLHLPGGTMAKQHRLMEPAGDQVRILKFDPQPEGDRRTSLVPHTDFGSVTVLFNMLGGLQILPNGKENKEENWEYVKPEKGCAIVNLGDTLVKWTNGLLQSVMHRVTYAPGDQSTLTRWSLAYFSHAEDTSLMKRMEGSDVIPPLAEGVVEEDLTIVDWTALGGARYKQDSLKNAPEQQAKQVAVDA